jgi:PASTA domain
VRRRLLLLSTLVGLAFALSIGIEAALAGNAVSRQVTLTVSVRGTGFGEVFSRTTASFAPAIVCPRICSAHFPVGTKVALHVSPAVGSAWEGLDGYCRRAPSDKPWVGCLVTLTADTSIEFVINLRPTCHVPKLYGKTLKAAKHAIRTHNCALGKITHTASLRVGKGHVTSQKPKPGTHLRYLAKVNLVVSRGRR